MTKMNSDTNSDMNSDSNIQEAKLRLPLPRLMQELGYGDRAKSSARCMFHDDKNPSFGIFQKEGQWFWKCQAGCGHGNEIHFLAKAKGTDVKEATKEFLRMAGVESKAKLVTASAPTSAPKQAATTEAKTATVQPRPLGELLDAVVAILWRYVVFSLPEQASVIAAWIVHTHLLEAFDYTAYLFVFSASKRSGKSRVLEVIEQLARKPIKTEGGSAAALVRSVGETDPPTMLLDEMDALYSKKTDSEGENTRRFLNAGYRRGAKFLRCFGQGAEINAKDFPAFCPKALAGIDRCLPDTVMDPQYPN